MMVCSHSLSELPVPRPYCRALARCCLGATHWFPLAMWATSSYVRVWFVGGEAPGQTEFMKKLLCGVMDVQATFVAGTIDAKLAPAASLLNGGSFDLMSNL